MEDGIIESDKKLNVIFGIYLTLILTTFSYIFLIRSEPLLPSIAFTWIVGGLAGYTGVNWLEKTSMRMFPIGTSPRKKMGIFWLYTFVYALVLQQLLTLTYGAESVLQCDSDFSGEILVENCTEFAKTQELFFPLGGILSVIAIFHTYQAYMERKRKNKLSSAMNKYALEELFRLERILKTINKIGNQDLFFEHKSELVMICTRLNNNIPNELQIREPFDLISINRFAEGVRFWVETTAMVTERKIQSERAQFRAQFQSYLEAQEYRSDLEMKPAEEAIHKPKKRSNLLREIVSIILWPISFVWQLLTVLLFLHIDHSEGVQSEIHQRRERERKEKARKFRRKFR